MINSLLDKFNHEICNAESALFSDASFSRLKLELIKDVFDTSVSISKYPAGPITSLHVDDVDDDIIWEELKSRTTPLVRQIAKRTGKLLRWSKKSEIECDDEYEEERSMHESVDNSVEQSISFSVENISGQENGELSLAEEGSEDGSGDESMEGSQNQSGSLHGSEDDMEAWLDREDEEETIRIKNSGDGVDHEDGADEGDDMALVKKMFYDSDASDSDEELVDSSGADYRFEDFFVAERCDRKRISNGTAAVQKDVGVSNLDMQDNGTKNKDSGVFQTKGKAFDEVDSPLLNQISNYEESLLAEKSWELRGEVKADQRPTDSLLEVSADIERY